MWWHTNEGGDDWKRDAKGNFSYDPNLTKENASTQLGAGETYVGAAAKVFSWDNHQDGSDYTYTDFRLNEDGSFTDTKDLNSSTTYVNGSSATTADGHTINSYNPEGSFTFRPEVTANITAAAGGAVELKNGMGASGGKGITGIGFKDNQFFLAGHSVTSNGFGPETVRTWGDVHSPVIGWGFENTVERTGGKVVSNTEKTSVSLSPFVSFEQTKNVQTGKVSSQISVGTEFL